MIHRLAPAQPAGMRQAPLKFAVLRILSYNSGQSCSQYGARQYGYWTKIPF